MAHLQAHTTGETCESGTRTNPSTKIPIGYLCVSTHLLFIYVLCIRMGPGSSTASADPLHKSNTPNEQRKQRRTFCAWPILRSHLHQTDIRFYCGSVKQRRRPSECAHSARDKLCAFEHFICARSPLQRSGMRVHFPE